MSFFHLYALNSVLWKFLRFFLDLKLYMYTYIIYSLLNIWKQQNLGFACIQGGKTSKYKSRYKSEKIHFLSNFVLQDLLFWQKARYETMYNFQKYFFQKTCNLGHCACIYSNLYTKHLSLQQGKKILESIKLWNEWSVNIIIHPFLRLNVFCIDNQCNVNNISERATLTLTKFSLFHI